MSIQYSEHYCTKRHKVVMLEETYSKPDSENKPQHLYCMESARCLDTDCEFVGKDHHYIDQ